MKVIELTNRVLFLEDIIQIYEEYSHYYAFTKNGTCEITKNDYFKIKNYLLSLNDEVEILKEEKKIPEKLDISNGISVVNCAYKINEIVDYLKSKGE